MARRAARAMTPAWLALAIVATALGGCADAGPGADGRRLRPGLVADAAPQTAAASALAGSAWRLEDLAGAGVLDRVEATLEFREPGKLAGNGSCNRFSGAVEVSGSSLRVGPLVATRRACVEAVSRQEERYLEALERIERFAIDGSTLRLWGRGATAPLRFSRIE